MKTRLLQNHAFRAAGTCIILGAAFALFYWYSLSPVFGTTFSEVPGDLGDARLNNYILEHGYKYLTGQAPSYWNAGFFYPHPRVIAYADNLLGALAFYVPYRYLALDRETAFQAWIVTGYFLNFAAMAFVLLRAKVSPWAAALGAAVFAFSPLQTLHLNHAQLLYRAPVPLAWHFFNRFLDRPRAAPLAAGLVFVIWQIYISLYIGYFLVLILAVCIVAALFEKSGFLSYLRSAPLRQRLGHAGLIAGAALTLLPVWREYSSPNVQRNPLTEVLDLLPRPAGYLIGSRDRLMERILGADLKVQSQFPWEHALFVGIIPWVAMLLFTSRVIRRQTANSGNGKRIVLSFWGVFALTLSVCGVSLYRFVVEAAPALTGIRGVTRVALILLLPFSLAVGYEFDALLRKVSKSAAGVWVAVAILLVWGTALWDSGVRCVTTGKAHAQERVDRIKKSIHSPNPAPVLSRDGPILAAYHTNSSEPDYAIQIDAMIAAQDLNLVTLNGHTRYAPPGFRLFAGCEELAAMLREYERIFPHLPARETMKRLIFVPNSKACAGGP